MCWHRAERPENPANKVVPQEMYFLSLFPLGEQGLFYLEETLWNELNADGDAPIDIRHIIYNVHL